MDANRNLFPKDEPNGLSDKPKESENVHSPKELMKILRVSEQLGSEGYLPDRLG